MAMKTKTGKIIDIPKKPFDAKLIYIHDVVFSIAFILALILLIPFDVSTGFIGESVSSNDEVKAAIEDTNRHFSESYFAENLGKNGNLFTGGYVYNALKKDYIMYTGGMSGGKYEKFSFGELGMFEKKSSSKLPAPGVMISEDIVVLDEDGYIYYDDMDGLRGRYDITWRDMLMTDGRYDYPRISAMFLGDEKKSISFKDAVMIAALIADNRLIGYSDGISWFADYAEDGTADLIKSDPDGYEKELDIPEFEIDAVVADGKYLIQDHEGMLSIINIEERTQNLITINGQNGESEPVLGFTFDIKDSKVRVHAFSETVYYIAYLTGNGSEIENQQVTYYREGKDYKEAARGISVTDNTTVWLFFGNDDYVWYRLK